MFLHPTTTKTTPTVIAVKGSNSSGFQIWTHTLTMLLLCCTMLSLRLASVLPFCFWYFHFDIVFQQFWMAKRERTFSHHIAVGWVRHSKDLASVLRCEFVKYMRIFGIIYWPIKKETHVSIYIFPWNLYKTKIKKFIQNFCHTLKHEPCHLQLFQNFTRKLFLVEEKPIFFLSFERQ